MFNDKIGINSPLTEKVFLWVFFPDYIGNQTLVSVDVKFGGFKDRSSPQAEFKDYLWKSDVRKTLTTLT